MLQGARAPSRLRPVRRPLRARPVWFVLALAIAPAAAHADERIGNTALAHNEVQRLINTATSPIQAGDDVFANENVRTGADSSAKFVFSDQTNLAVGPTSTVKLDKFVFKGDTSYAKAAMGLAVGAFRFTTGASDKRAYEIRTSTATIGVRGTVFDVLVTPRDTVVTLVEGAVAVCPRSNFDGDPRRLSKTQLKRFHCQELDRPGQSTKVALRVASSPAGTVPFSFAGSVCGGDSGLCSSSSSAALNPNNPALCYVNTD